MKSYSDYLRDFFPNTKVQKISVNAGFSCPNRDGKIGVGGCSYCRNDSFSPAYCMETLPVSQQIEKGKEFFSRKYPQMKFLAYFQSYTSTYSHNLSTLEALYREALGCGDVVGLVVGTRPDTLPDPVLDLLGDINRKWPVFLEIGAETSSDKTLELINRHHTWTDVVNAVERSAARGLHCGLHLIAGLPGEERRQILRNVELACALPIDTLKIHQLQILEGTPLLARWRNGEVDVEPFALENYLELCADIVEMVPENIVIERFLAQSPPELVVAPRWGLKNYQFIHLLEGIIRERKR